MPLNIDSSKLNQRINNIQKYLNQLTSSNFIKYAENNTMDDLPPAIAHRPHSISLRTTDIEYAEEQINDFDDYYDIDSYPMELAREWYIPAYGPHPKDENYWPSVNINVPDHFSTLVELINNHGVLYELATTPLIEDAYYANFDDFIEYELKENLPLTSSILLDKFIPTIPSDKAHDSESFAILIKTLQRYLKADDAVELIQH